MKYSHLLVEDGLGLSTETLLLVVVPTLALKQVKPEKNRTNIKAAEKRKTQGGGITRQPRTSGRHDNAENDIGW